MTTFLIYLIRSDLKGFGSVWIYLLELLEQDPYSFHNKEPGPGVQIPLSFWKKRSIQTSFKTLLHCQFNIFFCIMRQNPDSNLFRRCWIRICNDMRRRLRLVAGNAKSLRLKSNLEKDFAQLWWPSYLVPLQAQRRCFWTLAEAAHLSQDSSGGRCLDWNISQRKQVHKGTGVKLLFPKIELRECFTRCLCSFF